MKKRIGNKNFGRRVLLDAVLCQNTMSPFYNINVRILQYEMKN
eukprot:UN07010